MAGDTGAITSQKQSICFHNEDRTVIVIDVPKSIEEAQVLPFKLEIKSTLLKRLVSSNPIEKPFKTPDPKNGNGGLTDSVSDLMACAAAWNAIEALRKSFFGSYCLPRITSPLQLVDVANGQKRKGEAPAAEDEQMRRNGPELIFPEGSFYLNGSISSERERFLTDSPSFDLVVLDPPWPNRSARRKRDNYKTADNMDELRQTLSLVPIASRLAPNGLVAVWVTNKASVVELMTGSNGIFAEWGMEIIDEWTWLKVTITGEPIVDIHSTWRKPWERLLIARRRGSNIMPSSRGRVLVSVPDLHSRKPNLRGLFEDVFTPGFMGLEVFARNLTAGWWSWGDEVLKFQQSEHWVEP